MKSLFDSTTINGMQLSNRLVRSATWEGLCDEQGRATQRMNAYYEALAKGETGLIVSGYTYVRRDGKQLPGQMGLTSDDDIPSLKELADAVHAAGGKLCLQLVHCGGQATSEAAAGRTVAPSSIETPQFPEKPQELSLDDIAELEACFAAAARRAKQAGCDAVQLHGAHGYLINQFLSPLTNRRRDTYGGSLDNRSRFLLETYRSVRGAVGRDFPVMIKLNGCDNIDGGLTCEDACHVARLLDGEGIDAIEVSGGTPASGDQTPVRSGISTPDREGYNLDLARRIGEVVDCPVMSVGGFRSREVIEEALRGIDYIALSRPLIREPSLPRRWRQGDSGAATCISCNGCFRPGLKGEGIRCVVEG